MSEQVSREEQAAPTDQRFVDFVINHAEQALRWEVVEPDPRPSVPLSWVEFTIEALDGDGEYLNFPPLGRFIMKAYVRLPLEKQSPGSRVAPVIVESAYGQLSLSDESEELPAIIGDYQPETDQLSAANLLMDRLDALETEGKLISAGRRDYRIRS